MEISRERTVLSLSCRLWGSEKSDVDTTIALSHEGSHLNVLFSVREKEMRRMVWEDEGPVWTDSCVEVFIKAPSAEEYSNFEFSASGAMHACHGRSKSGRVPYTAEEKKAVTRSVRILENNNRQSRWELTLSIDLEAFGLVEDGRFLFNAYKCGDGLKEPHYLSLFPIETAEPDYHRPEFFNSAELV